MTGFNKNDGYSESYAYDPVGNMTQKGIGGVNISMTYNAANQLKSMESAKGKDQLQLRQERQSHKQGDRRKNGYLQL